MSAAVRLVAAAELDRLAAQAAAAPRGRAHLLLHADHQDQVQRLLIAAQPGTYVRPHRHTGQWEMLVLQRGRLDLLFYDGNGTVERHVALDEAAPLIVIPSGIWHSGVVCRPDTILLEVKPGPFRDSAFADWSPAEGQAGAPAFVTWAGRAKPGDVWDGASA